jgi:hypothetical protein
MKIRLPWRRPLPGFPVRTQVPDLARDRGSALPGLAAKTAAFLAAVTAVTVFVGSRGVAFPDLYRLAWLITGSAVAGVIVFVVATTQAAEIRTWQIRRTAGVSGEADPAPAEEPAADDGAVEVAPVPVKAVA